MEVLNNDTQCALQQKLGVKHGPEKVSEVKFVDVLAVGHRQTWADREDHVGLHLLELQQIDFGGWVYWEGRIVLPVFP